MKAFKYQVRVDNDIVHSWSGKVIDEIFVSEKKLFINNAHGIFIGDEQQYTQRLGTINAGMVKKVDVEDEIIEKLLVIAKNRPIENILIDKLF
jgi:hypothetical protein